MIHSPAQQVLANAGFNSPITAASNNGATVNAEGFTRAMAVFDTSPSGTGTTSDCKLQDSPDGSTWTNVPGATFTQGTTAGGHTIQCMDINLTYRQQYLRLVHTGAGGSAAGQAVGQIYLFNASQMSVTQAITPTYPTGG